MAIEAIKAGDFALVISDKLAEHGIEKLSYVYLAGDTLLPESEEDPYLYRKYFIAARVVDHSIQANEKPFLVNAVDLEKVKGLDLAKLTSQYELDFGDKDGDA